MRGSSPHTHPTALVSYDSKPGPRHHGEYDVKSYIEALKDKLREARDNLKHY